MCGACPFEYGGKCSRGQCFHAHEVSGVAGCRLAIVLTGRVSSFEESKTGSNGFQMFIVIRPLIHPTVAELATMLALQTVQQAPTAAEPLDSLCIDLHLDELNSTLATIGKMFSFSHLSEGSIQDSGKNISHCVTHERVRNSLDCSSAINVKHELGASLFDQYSCSILFGRSAVCASRTGATPEYISTAGFTNRFTQI